MTLEARHLNYNREQKTIFRDISFRLNEGDILCVQDQNGAGKSSLLRLLTGLVTPTQGDILWCHQPIQKINFHDHLHYVGHTNGIKLGLTVTENLQLLAQLHGEPITMLDEILSLLQLTAHQHQLARHLSAGQKRRLALAKLWLLPKPLWLLDEPLTALDTHTQTLFLSRLEKHQAQSGITIIASHHPITLATHTLRLSPC